MRLTLGAILGTSAFGLLAYLSMAFPDPQWRAVLENTFGALLLLMLVAGAASKGVPRSFAIGFAVASLAYFALSFLPALGLRHKLITHRALEMAQEKLVGQVPTVAFASPKNSPPKIPELRMTPVVNRAEAAVEHSVAKEPPFDPESYFAAGHLLWTLLFGFLGGTVAGGIARSNTRNSPRDA